MNHEQEKTKTIVHIFGNEYRLVSEAKSGYMEKIALYVHQHMMEIAEANPRLDSQRISVLTSVHIADELFQLRESMRNSGNAPLKLNSESNAELQMAYDQLVLDFQELQIKFATLNEELVEKKSLASRPPSMEDRANHSEELSEELTFLKEEHEQLQQEYQKLKNEYNEYTKFVITNEGDTA